MVEYVKKLQELNNIDIEIPQEDIETVIKNPKQYALNFVEFHVTKNLLKFIEANKIGVDFASKNMELDSEKG